MTINHHCTGGNSWMGIWAYWIDRLVTLPTWATDYLRWCWFRLLKHILIDLEIWLLLFPCNKVKNRLSASLMLELKTSEQRNPSWVPKRVANDGCAEHENISVEGREMTQQIWSKFPRKCLFLWPSSYTSFHDSARRKRKQNSNFVLLNMADAHPGTDTTGFTGKVNSWYARVFLETQNYVKTACECFLCMYPITSTGSAFVWE